MNYALIPPSQGFSEKETQAIRHRGICYLHPPDSISCCVITAKGLQCRYRGRNGISPNESIPGRMPVCGNHRLSAPSAGRCKTILSCGSECGKLIKWSPGEFRLCSDHSTDKPCYFLSIPTELRLRIYKFLFLDRCYYPDDPTYGTVKRGRRTSIFRVNRQIHEEAADVYYGSPPFNIAVSSKEVIMSMFSGFWPDRLRRNMLEPKARLDRAGFLNNDSITRLGVPKHPFLNYNTVKAPMGEGNFSKIRSFHISIDLLHLCHRTYSASDTSQDKLHKSSFYQVSSHLRQLVTLLNVVKPTIRRLSVSISVDRNFCPEEGDALLYSANVLLWLEGLKSVSNVIVESIVWENLRGGEEAARQLFAGFPGAAEFRDKLLFPFKDNGIPTEDKPVYHQFAQTLDLWRSTILSPGSFMESNPVLIAYTKLENLLWMLQTARVRRFREDDKALPEFIFRARAALHQNDMNAMHAICREATDTWTDHLKAEQSLRMCTWKELITLESMSTPPEEAGVFDEILRAMDRAEIGDTLSPRF